MATTHLLYLHGFRSSPLSRKAQQMHAAVAWRKNVHWLCPALPPSPAQAMHLVTQALAHWPRERMAVVGSSLGGFYATWVAQSYGCPAVLLNPAVNPARDLARHIGAQTNWHAPNQAFFFEPGFVDELRALDAGPLHHPERTLAIIAKGDEVLDWREMQSRYSDCPMRLCEGGDHALSDFPDHLPAILAFLGLG